MSVMTLTDRHGLPVSAARRSEVERYDQALALLNRFDADPLTEIDVALVEAPDFVMGHALRAALLVMSTERGLLPELRRTIRAAEAVACGATEREWGHLCAARAWLQGDLDDARRGYGEIAARWPRDLLAVQVAHQLDFFLGDGKALRDRPRVALRAWGPGEPGAGYLKGMLAFGLEECGEYEAAETAGRSALARNSDDAWATHAVAHVMEMQGRTAEGAAWLCGRAAAWGRPGNMLAVHNWWHLALFHLERGDQERALGVFDRGVRRATLAPAIELVDVSAMLWRFLLLGIPCGDRWAEAARLWDAQEPGFYAFNDCHAVMAYLGAGRPGDAQEVIAAMEATAQGESAQGEGRRAAMAREVGLPLARGLVAFHEGRHAEAAALMRPLRRIAHRFGGSHAQRDVIALTRLEAALRAGDRDEAAWLASARLAAKPESVLARGLAQRVARLRAHIAAD